MEKYTHNSGKVYISTQSKPKVSLKNESVVSLFSGSGGIDIGLENAGFQTRVCVEIDIHCRETLRVNRPDWGLVESNILIEDGCLIEREPGDIRMISTEEIIDKGNLQGENIGIVVGGAPCQPFSNIGKKEGRKDEKNGDLFLEFVRVVKGLQPEAFIFENVAGITQKKHDSVLSYMKEQFAGMGYSFNHGILNAADYGVPQKRERFFLIGLKGKEIPAFPLPSHFKDVSTRDAFVNSLNIEIDIPFQPWITVGEAFDSLPANYKLRKDYAVMNISDTVKARMRMIRPGENFKVLPMDMRPNCWKNGKHQGQDTFGRLRPDEPSVTIRTAAYNPSKGRYIHPFENRGLDTLELASLQSFPFEWEFKSKGREKITLVSGGRQIGNAVPPLLAEKIGLALRKQMDKARNKNTKIEFVKNTLVPH